VCRFTVPCPTLEHQLQLGKPSETTCAALLLTALALCLCHPSPRAALLRRAAAAGAVVALALRPRSAAALAPAPEDRGWDGGWGEKPGTKFGKSWNHGKWM